MKYALLTNINKMDFEEDVNNLLSRGWELYGPPGIAIEVVSSRTYPSGDVEQNTNWVYSQALTVDI